MTITYLLCGSLLLLATVQKDITALRRVRFVMKGGQVYRNVPAGSRL